CPRTSWSRCCWGRSTAASRAWCTWVTRSPCSTTSTAAPPAERPVGFRSGPGAPSPVAAAESLPHELEAQVHPGGEIDRGIGQPLLDRCSHGGERRGREELGRGRLVVRVLNA